MARLSEQEISRVRTQASIVDVISHYIPLNKSGRNYRAICPFHDDHDPSMNISEDKQIFKCFVCGAGGNVFSFVQKYEKAHGAGSRNQFAGHAYDAALVLEKVVPVALKYMAWTWRSISKTS